MEFPMINAMQWLNENSDITTIQQSVDYLIAAIQSKSIKSNKIFGLFKDQIEPMSVYYNYLHYGGDSSIFKDWENQVIATNCDAFLNANCVAFLNANCVAFLNANNDAFLNDAFLLV